MSTETELKFSLINYEVCYYCSHLVRGKYRNGYIGGCEIRQNEAGKYARISLGGQCSIFRKYGLDVVDGIKGCEQFQSSGMPAHPIVLESLLKANAKCADIPTNQLARETSADFERKVKEYLPKKNFTSSSKIQ